MAELTPKQKNPPNPRGNPNLWKARKTGPRTKEGKMRSARNLPQAFTSGKSSHLLALQRADGCKKCPLGTKTKTRIINGKEHTIVAPAICPYFKEDSKVCKLPLEDMAYYMRHYNEIFSEGGEEHVLKILALDLLKDSKNAEVVETFNKGSSGHYTMENKKAAAEILDKLLRLKTPTRTENKNLNVNMDVGDYVDMSQLLGDEE